MVQGHHSGDLDLQRDLHGFASDPMDFESPIPNEIPRVNTPPDFVFIMMKHELHHLDKSREFWDFKSIELSTISETSPCRRVNALLPRPRPDTEVTGRCRGIRSRYRGTTADTETTHPPICLPRYRELALIPNHRLPIPRPRPVTENSPWNRLNALIPR
jgi:hypothetical protein